MIPIMTAATTSAKISWSLLKWFTATRYPAIWHSGLHSGGIRDGVVAGSTICLRQAWASCLPPDIILNAKWNQSVLSRSKAA
jgi:hypothetical protein